LITCGSTAEKFLEKTKDVDLIAGIVIFCMNVKKYLGLKEKYTKCFEVVNDLKDILPLIERLKINF